MQPNVPMYTLISIGCVALCIVSSIALVAADRHVNLQENDDTRQLSPSVLVTHALVKVRPDLPIPSSAVAIQTISAARNEYESFQIIVSVPQGGSPASVSHIGVDFSDVLDSSSILVHREHYINISTVSNCAGAVGRWPDALIPETDPFDKQQRNAFPATIPPGTNQAFFIDIFVKNGTAPGTHPGQVRLQWSGTNEDTVLPISLTVYSFTLPSISRYSTTYNCPLREILAGRFLDKIPNATSAQHVQWQKQYVNLGLMHRITFSDFLAASTDILGVDSGTIDFTSLENDWGAYLGSDGQSVDTEFGLGATRPTTIQLPALHYPGPPMKNTTVFNRSGIDALWHATGCSNPTPEWGYSYWSGLPNCGTSDMFTYCVHSEAGKNDPWSRTCAPVGTKVKCVEQTAPPQMAAACANTPKNNTLAINYWRAISEHSRAHGWWDRVFDYTCDEPGAGAGRYPVCRAHAETIHEADPAYKVMITAEKPSADSVNISSMIDIWVPIINFMDSPSACEYPSWAHGNRREIDYAPLVAEGKGLWWYQSCMSEGCASAVQPAHGSSAPGCDLSHTCTNAVFPNVTWPSYMIDAPATFNRVMSWMSYQYEIEGELYWGTNAADSQYTDPTNSSWETQWIAGGNGDGSLTYPGRPDHIGGQSTIPIASLRLKQIRDGLEDLEYMYILEDLTGSRSAAAKIVSNVVHTTYNFEHEPSAMITARSQLAKSIEALADKQK